MTEDKRGAWLAGRMQVGYRQTVRGVDFEDRQTRWAPGLPSSTANDANVYAGALLRLTVVTMRRSVRQCLRSTRQRT
jgi:hypothetical protein